MSTLTASIARSLGAATLVVAVGCAPAATAPDITLTVFAAASLTDAFNALKVEYEAEYPGTTIVYNFAGSSALAQQLAQGAPADVFASANQNQMQAAVDTGRVAGGGAQVFARNRLVVIMPADNPAGLEQLQDLAKPGVRLVLAAPQVPVGQYTLDFLAKSTADPAFGEAFQAAVLANVVSYEDNVRSVLAKVALGEADAGIVYMSDVSAEGADQVAQFPIPDALNTIAAYPIAVIADSGQAAQAQAFVAYVLSAEGQATLERFGFLPVER